MQDLHITTVTYEYLPLCLCNLVYKILIAFSIFQRNVILGYK